MKFYDFDVTLHIRACDIEAGSLEEAIGEAIENGTFEILGQEINSSQCFFDSDEEDEE